MYWHGREMESMGVKDKTIVNNQRVSALDSHEFGLESLRNNTRNSRNNTESISSEIAEEEIFRSMRIPTKGRVSIKIFHNIRNISVIILLCGVILIAVVIGITLYYKISPRRDSPRTNASPMIPPSLYLKEYNGTGMYSIGPIKHLRF